MKTVFFNGEFVPEESAHVSVFDRGFLYGDGLFETLRIYNTHPFRWQSHWERFAAGADCLQIPLSITSEDALALVRELLRRNSTGNAIVRINLSRGQGKRGYSTRNSHSPAFVISLHEAPTSPEKPVCWRVRTSSLRVLKKDPLAAIKTSSKLLQVMAKAEAEQSGHDEALLLNSEGEVAEGTSGNVFWIEAGKVCTPPLDAGILPGVTRAVVLEICKETGIPHEEKAATLTELKNAEAAFLTLSSLEMVEIQTLDEHCFPGSDLLRKLLQSYRQVVALEIARTA
ncbi:MAG: aminodeoxychorismate lyase [Limisphaerales bacterium]